MSIWQDFEKSEVYEAIKQTIKDNISFDLEALETITYDESDNVVDDHLRVVAIRGSIRANRLFLQQLEELIQTQGGYDHE